MLSLAELARQLGRSKSGLHELSARGTIPRNADGTFDRVAVEVALQNRVDPARRKKDRAGGPPSAAEREARAAVALIRRILAEEGAPSEQRQIDFDAVRTAETILKARERDLRIEIERRRLIDAGAARKEVLALARQERDALLNWPARIGPLLAAEFAIDQVALTVSLERHIREHLSGRSEPALRLAS